MTIPPDLRASRPLRYWELDLLRGVAVAMMILYHALYDLDYFSGPDILDVRSGIWPSFALATASIFLLLVGVSLSISSARTRISGWDFLRRSIRRGAIIFSWGVAITFTTFLLLEEGYVLFGILHLIGATIVLSIPFIRRPLLALLLGLAAISAGIFLRQFSFETPWLLWLGFVPLGYYSVDYFPLLPWSGVVLVGIFLGGRLYPHGKRGFQIPDLSSRTPAREISFLGRNSLLIYFLHQPLLIILMELLGVIDIAGRVSLPTP
ncbi:heparan-alpha-glucosaminide N-acetyltransferase [Candidatus Methanocrinis natronophilus]|uniref:Heparan-alpha-glucosaminide N-acetyltransferase n=1 Tax=Candidatus Methanocrinis natronophilus TaxID=3033396 RepID=A0ABT5X4Y1_9EURY|nr:heparan-alpha-glucosaminide N-acetyltransferase [Candidatus Methanocrinis natronophilus]MDF0589748.1 heparan-alpha-glucosaminide N-acetyltransferase [Candidatus Methanocrinis natronophilus]